jgi:Bacterial PH domain
MARQTDIALDRNERVLWSGGPPQGLVLHGYDAFLIPFSLIWAGIAFGGFGVTIMQHARPGMAPVPTFAYLPMALFGVAGLYITIGRFIVDSVARSYTSYAITTDRVIIQSGLFTSTLKSLNLRTLSDLTLSERANGSGTITFGPVNPWKSWGAGMQWPGMLQTPMFEGIPNARAVYGIIRDAQRASMGVGAAS